MNSKTKPDEVSGASDGSLSGPLVELFDPYSGAVAISPDRIESISVIFMVDGRRVDGYSKVLLTNGKCYVAKSPDTESLRQRWQHCLRLREQVNNK